jgi:putative transposase
MNPRQYPEFTTITALEWKPVLKPAAHKQVIIESLRYLVKEQRVLVFSFVLMDNHFHLIWQMKGSHKREDVQRDFLRFTSQQILKILRNKRASLLEELYVGAVDRRYQVWERNSLSIKLWTPYVFKQKLRYIHNNPVKAGLCILPEEYEFSSAGYYEKNEIKWDFLNHYKG